MSIVPVQTVLRTNPQKTVAVLMEHRDNQVAQALGHTVDVEGVALRGMAGGRDAVPPALRIQQSGGLRFESSDPTAFGIWGLWAARAFVHPARMVNGMVNPFRDHVHAESLGMDRSG